MLVDVASNVYRVFPASHHPQRRVQIRSQLVIWRSSVTRGRESGLDLWLIGSCLILFSARSTTPIHVRSFPTVAGPGPLAERAHDQSKSRWLGEVRLPRLSDDFPEIPATSASCAASRKSRKRHPADKAGEREFFLLNPPHKSGGVFQLASRCLAHESCSKRRRSSIALPSMTCAARSEVMRGVWSAHGNGSATQTAKSHGTRVQAQAGGRSAAALVRPENINPMAQLALNSTTPL